MINEMTDEARDEAFTRTQQNVFDMIFGHHDSKTVNEVETRVVDFRFGQKMNWMDNNRMTPNNDMSGIGEYNDLKRKSNGYLMK